KKIWLYILVPILVVLICFSRVLLGVHYIGDVILGFLIGAILLAMLYFAIPPLLNWMENWPTWVKILASEIYGVIVFIMTFIPALYANWPSLEESANKADVVCALMLFPIFIWIENKWIKMDNDNLSKLSIFLRILVGTISLVGMYFGLSALFGLITYPSLGFKAAYSVNYLLRFLRYSILITILGLGMPLLFSRVEIFSRKRPVAKNETILATKA
ncbi:MAG: phosphatase PAP2 family protein, partial [Candidatus Heimdallarchaeota archaeon]